MKLVVSDVDVNTLMRDAVATVTPHARKKGLRVAWKPAQLPAVQCDREKIRQALINLVSNAVKFTPSGGSVTVEAHADGDDRVAVQVVDTGIGIAPQNLGRVFDVFFQVDGTTTREFGGAGLGLAIVKSYVEAHAGDGEGRLHPGRGDHLHRLPAGDGLGPGGAGGARRPHRRGGVAARGPAPASSGSSSGSPARSPAEKGWWWASATTRPCCVRRRGEDLVATVDAVVEGVHFTRAFAPEDMGWKSLAVNLSDLAAMGARPLWALVALATPPGADPGRLARIGRGIAACARRHGVSVVGGNVTAADRLSLTVTVVGAGPRGRALLRSGGRPGDLLVVCGTLGDAALGIGAGAAPPLRRRQRRPEPRLALGRAAAGIARAAIDLSDGLLQDLGHLCAASGVGARVEVERLPLSAAYRAATRRRLSPTRGPSPAARTTNSCSRCPPARLAALRVAAARRSGTPVTVVGALEARPGVRVVKGGRVLRPRRPGHDHLRPGRVLGPGRGRA